MIDNVVAYILHVFVFVHKRVALFTLFFMPTSLFQFNFNSNIMHIPLVVLQQFVL